jgi:hypothetical protein
MQSLFSPSSSPLCIQTATNMLTSLATQAEIAVKMVQMVQSNTSLLQRLVSLLTLPNATQAPFFVSTFALLNTLLQHELPGRELSEEICRNQTILTTFVDFLKHDNIQNVALSSVMALLNMASHDSTRHQLCMSIARTDCAISAIRRMLVNPHIAQSTSTVLWLLCNLIIVPLPSQYQLDHRDHHRRHHHHHHHHHHNNNNIAIDAAVIIPTLLNEVEYDQGAQMVSNKHFSQLLPELLHIAQQTVVISGCNNNHNNDSESTVSIKMGTCQMKAIALVEQLVKFGGYPLSELCNRCQQSITQLVSLARICEGDGANVAFLVSVLEILTHIFHGYHTIAIQQAVHSGALNVLCHLLCNHRDIEVRCQSAKALGEFIVCPDEIVSSSLLHPQCNVLSVLCNKCLRSGDISQEVREQTILGVLNLVQCSWITEMVVGEILVCCTSFLSEMTTPQILAAVLMSLEKILLSNSATHPKFEACGGFNKLERLLYAGTTSPNVEANIVKIINLLRHEEEEQSAMETEDVQPLSVVFGLMGGDGRCW